MSDDYLSRRQNVVQQPIAELNAKLKAIADTFGESWLQADDRHPLQDLWKRQDALSTNELLNFGDAVERWENADRGWLDGQAKLVKFGDAGQQAGAIFEIIGLNLFTEESCQVIPAPDAMPGFDGTLILKDGSRVVVSIKNHGLSTRERKFQEEAKRLDEEFKTMLRSRGVGGVELNVLAAKHLDATLFGSLKSDVESCLVAYLAGGKGGESDRPYSINLRNMEGQYGPLSNYELSSCCRIISPMAKNEQVNFHDSIRKGCANLHKHTKDQGSDVCRMIMLRLSNTASIALCKKWADWYFEEYPDDPVDVILLYQVSVVSDISGETSSIVHYVSFIPGPRFKDWQRKPGGGTRRLPNMSVLVGRVSTEQPSMVLANERGETLDLGTSYVYQRADAYLRMTLSEGATGNLSNPVSGIMIHAVVESENGAEVVLSSKAEREKVLTLLP